MARIRCIKCGFVVNDLDFPTRNRRKATIQKYCNSCKKTYWKEYYKANKVGLLRQRKEKLLSYQEKTGTHPKRPWQPSEIDFLYENQGKQTILQMAEKLGRSWQSVQSKLKRLNGIRNEVDSVQGEEKIYKAAITVTDTLSQEDLDRGRRLLETGGDFKKLEVKNGCDN